MFDDFDYEPYENDIENWEAEMVFQDTVAERDDMFADDMEEGADEPDEADDWEPEPREDLGWDGGWEA